MVLFLTKSLAQLSTRCIRIQSQGTVRLPNFDDFVA
jgi:hypothetical protein